ncbi:hypothetical protein WMY93_024472 [Mugilogobius chulae]|uniref:MOB kinase activator 3A n=1 Tax=Mugilogobius chulae TaxID=88201 RepID=A0AAW0NAQ3_9GOBI
MSGGLRYEYRWQDGEDYKRPTKLPALKYMNLLMDWIESLINNEDIFPTRVGVPFPKNFQQVCKKIVSRLFRVFVHVYIHHFDSICSMGAEAHINTCYKHYYYFITEFHLIDNSELQPLKEIDRERYAIKRAMDKFTFRLYLSPRRPFPFHSVNVFMCIGKLRDYFHLMFIQNNVKWLQQHHRLGS